MSNKSEISRLEKSFQMSQSVLEDVTKERDKLRIELDQALGLLIEIDNQIGADDFGDLIAYFSNDMILKLEEFLKNKKVTN